MSMDKHSSQGSGKPVIIKTPPLTNSDSASGAGKGSNAGPPYAGRVIKENK